MKMLCASPYVPFGTSLAHPCGRCLACRIMKRRIWAHRMVLETFSHRECSFVTLTYDDKHLPKGGTLVPKDCTDWLKRIRKEFPSRSLRYYLVGEYGDRTQRPHYHAAMYGLPSCSFGSTKSHLLHGGGRLCSACDLVQSTWGHGSVHLDELNEVTASYICGYVTKKLTRKGLPSLGGRYPEFARMSRKPGIGNATIKKLLPVFFSKHGRAYIETHGIPSTLEHGGKSQPLGPYLRKVIHEAALQAGLCVPTADTPENQARAAEMRDLRKRHALVSPLKVPLSWMILAQSVQGRRDLAAKQKLIRGKTL